MKLLKNRKVDSYSTSLTSGLIEYGDIEIPPFRSIDIHKKKETESVEEKKKKLLRKSQRKIFVTAIYIQSTPRLFKEKEMKMFFFFYNKTIFIKFLNEKFIW